MQILLIEDEQDHADLAKRSLRSSGIEYELTHVDNGAEGIQYLRQESPHQHALAPDVVLVDLKMPRMDGHEVIENIKADSGLKNTLVIALTTSEADGDRQRAFASGVDAYLSKPLNASALWNIVMRQRCV